MAAIECRRAYLFDVCTYVNVGRLSAKEKGTVSNRDDAFRDSYADQLLAVGECVIADGGDTVWNGQTDKAVAVVERVAAN